MYIFKAFLYGAACLSGLLLAIGLVIAAIVFEPMWVFDGISAFIFIAFSLIIGLEHYSDYDSHGT
jgi:hypothetical protein